MSERQDGIGWVPVHEITRSRADALLFVGRNIVEVAYGPELAALRRDRERLETLFRMAVKHNEKDNDVANAYDVRCGQMPYNMPEDRDEIDAAMEEKR